METSAVTVIELNGHVLMIDKYDLKGFTIIMSVTLWILHCCTFE